MQVSLCSGYSAYLASHYTKNPSGHHGQGVTILYGQLSSGFLSSTSVTNRQALEAACLHSALEKYHTSTMPSKHRNKKDYSILALNVGPSGKCTCRELGTKDAPRRTRCLTGDWPLLGFTWAGQPEGSTSRLVHRVEVGRQVTITAQVIYRFRGVRPF